MKFAIIENSKVANIAEAESPLASNWVPGSGARIGDEWDGTSFTTPPAPPVTADQVDAERDRRLAAGTVITVTGYGDIAVQGRVQDAVNYLALQSKAMKLDADGVTGAVLPFRDRDNTMHTLTPAQVIDLIDAGVSHAQSVYASAWALKDADPVPDNYTAEEHWP